MEKQCFLLCVRVYTFKNVFQSTPGLHVFLASVLRYRWGSQLLNGYKPISYYETLKAHLC